ncbi:hypothetical protein SLEP1_g31389 [Rubroshorea leprosula]|uniref:Secreted protein n=1 Tax=Rubroshorea leprosula TaxID=152421 RepID=A0AAV5K9T1_9ROSI|nr:hypothetical protein SLEP1_g31389 [Rubroshorea leprosula]
MTDFFLLFLFLLQPDSALPDPLCSRTRSKPDSSPPLKKNRNSRSALFFLPYCRFQLGEGGDFSSFLIS